MVKFEGGGTPPRARKWGTKKREESNSSSDEFSGNKKKERDDYSFGASKKIEEDVDMNSGDKNVLNDKMKGLMN